MTPRRTSWALALLLATGIYSPPVLAVDASGAFGRDTRNFVDGRIELQDPATKFDCFERIWAVFSVTDLDAGKQRLVIHWQSPNDELLKSRQVTRRIRSADETVWISSFLALEGSSGLASILDLSAGYEPYIGRWKASLMLNGREIAAGNFQVLC